MMTSLLLLSVLAGTGDAALEIGNERAVYAAEGRRDPFVNLATAPRNQGCTSGLRSFASAQLALRGTVQVKGEFVAVLAAPDGKTYFARAGQPLYDGRIEAVSSSRVILRQDVCDRSCDLPAARKLGTRLAALEFPQP